MSMLSHFVKPNPIESLSLVRLTNLTTAIQDWVAQEAEQHHAQTLGSITFDNAFFTNHPQFDLNPALPALKYLSQNFNHQYKLRIDGQTFKYFMHFQKMTPLEIQYDNGFSYRDLQTLIDWINDINQLSQIKDD